LYSQLNIGKCFCEALLSSFSICHFGRCLQWFTNYCLHVWMVAHLLSMFLTFCFWRVLLSFFQFSSQLRMVWHRYLLFMLPRSCSYFGNLCLVQLQLTCSFVFAKYINAKRYHAIVGKNTQVFVCCLVSPEDQSRSYVLTRVCQENNLPNSLFILWNFE